MAETAEQRAIRNNGSAADFILRDTDGRPIDLTTGQPTTEEKAEENLKSYSQAEYKRLGVPETDD